MPVFLLKTAKNADLAHSPSWKAGSFGFLRIFVAPIGSRVVQTWRRKFNGSRVCCEHDMLMRVLTSLFLFLLIGAIRNVNCLETKEGGKFAVFVWNKRL